MPIVSDAGPSVGFAGSTVMTVASHASSGVTLPQASAGYARYAPVPPPVQLAVSSPVSVNGSPACAGVATPANTAPDVSTATPARFMASFIDPLPGPIPRGIQPPSPGGA